MDERVECSEKKKSGFGNAHPPFCFLLGLLCVSVFHSEDQ